MRSSYPGSPSSPGSTCCIPRRYRVGMTKQIAVRLPDDLVAFVDDVVGGGEASSRAVVVTRALERERRRAIAARDAAILVAASGDPDMQALAEHAARASLDLE